MEGGFRVRKFYNFNSSLKVLRRTLRFFFEGKHICVLGEGVISGTSYVLWEFQKSEDR